MNNYIVTGGGTGGHLLPGLMIAEELNKDGNVIYIASKNGIDREIINGQDISFEVKYWDLRGFKRSFSPVAIMQNIVTLFKLMILSIKAICLILKLKPKTVIGVGGYISFPIVFWGKILGSKAVIHEQNSFPGVTNRQLGKRVDTVMATYKSSMKYFEASKLVMTSNPRIDIASKYASKKFYDITGMSEDITNILVVGGSLGAEVINDNIVKLAASDKTKHFYLVTGTRYYDDYVAKATDNLTIISYLDNPFEYFATADVVVTRAGATTLLELVAMEKLIVAIPSPNVVADHQTTNAKEFCRECMIKKIAEKDLDLPLLTSVLNDIIENKQSYVENIRKNKPKNSMDEIIKICK